MQLKLEILLNVNSNYVCIIADLNKLNKCKAICVNHFKRMQTTIQGDT